MGGGARGGRAATGVRWGARMRRLDGTRVVALAFGALLLCKLRGDLLNSSLLPVITSVYAGARDQMTLTEAFVGVVVLVCALRRPSFVARPAVSVGALVAGVVGFALVMIDVVVTRVGWLSSVAASLMGVGIAWLIILAMTACCRLETRVAVVVVPAAMAASRLVAHLVGPAAPSPVVTTALMAACLAGSFACALPLARPTLRDAAAGPALADAAITQPAAYLPVTSTLFVSLFFLKIAYGFTLRFGSGGGVIASTAVSVLTLAALAGWGAAHLRARLRQGFGRLYALAVLFDVLGFLVVPLGSFGWLASDFLAVAGATANVLIDCVLLATARRNRLGTVPVLATGVCVNTLGTTAGANVGILVSATGGTDAALLVCALTTGALLAYTLFVMHDFSFDDTINGIQPVRPVSVPREIAEAAAPTAGETLRGACAGLARDGGLSPRERDVLELLARGRNNAHIQEELVLSRNTVKSHIRHVYAKLGVHSQQELIDLVDARVAAGREGGAHGGGPNMPADGSRTRGA